MICGNTKNLSFNLYIVFIFDSVLSKIMMYYMRTGMILRYWYSKYDITAKSVYLDYHNDGMQY